jgi:FkbM family methyltransferase
MPSLKAVTKDLLNNIACRFGYRIDSIEHIERLSRSFERLSHSRRFDNWLARRHFLLRNRKITCVLDVGANSGQYARSLRLNGYGGQIVSFEPLKRAFTRLQAAASGDPMWRCENYALGAVDGMATINVSANSVSSSLLPILDVGVAVEPDTRYVKTEDIAIKTLDGVFTQFVADDAAVHLKIDVQGYEKRVLEGGRKSLQRIAMVQIEASLCSLYEGDSTIGEMLAWLEGVGFMPVSIEPGFYDETTGQQFQVDVLFWRK